jgi:hypothetical protein
MIPLRTFGDQTFNITLNGQEYRFRVRYNNRAAFWFLDLYLDETTLVNGAAMGVGVDILHQYALEIGSLFLIDVGGVGDPMLEDLGTNTVLVYYTPEEVDELRSGV